MPVDDVRVAAERLISILASDIPTLRRADDYLHGRHAGPYLPAIVTREYRMLAARAVTNWLPMIVGASAQALFVDGFRPGRVSPTDAVNDRSLPEWAAWQRSRMDAKQVALHSTAVALGHAFVRTQAGPGGAVHRILSPFKCVAMYEDAVNDIDPIAALEIKSMPDGDVPGSGVLSDDLYDYPVSFVSLSSSPEVRVGPRVLHGNTRTPVTRYVANIDTEGRTVGVILPLIPLQDRLSQSVFDLLLAQTGSSTKTRYITGMAPPPKRNADGSVSRDANGNPIPADIQYNSSRMIFAEDPDVKIGQLDETPLRGFIDAIELAGRQLSVASQTPPDMILGQMINVPADALELAHASLRRKNDVFRASFGESHERAARLAAELDGVDSAFRDEAGEVRWRVDAGSIASFADGASKLKDLGIPSRGLWQRVPGVTQNEINFWNDLADQESSSVGVGDLFRVTVPDEGVGSVGP